MLNSVEKAADQAQGMATDIRMVVDWMYRTGEDMRDELQKGMEVANKDIQRATECLKDEVSKLIENPVMATNEMSGLWDCQENGGPGHVSYADALNRQLLAAHLSTLTRSQVKERQVLIDKDPAAKLNQLVTLNECKLVAKARLTRLSHIWPLSCLKGLWSQGW